MKEIDKTDNMPKLVPDHTIVFDGKDRLRRAAEMDFDCSEHEYQCIIAAEEGFDNGDPLTGKYRQIRLKPDMNIVAPDKNRLKHRRPKLVFTLSGMSVAAAVVGLMLLTAKPIDTEIPTVTDTNRQETATNINKPVLPADSIENKNVPVVQKIASAEPARTKVRKKQETVRQIPPSDKTNEFPETEQNKATEQNPATEREHLQLAVIHPVNIQVESDKKIALSFNYGHPEMPIIDFITNNLIDNVICRVESLEISHHLQTWREKMFSRLHFTDILGNISSKHAINKYMKELMSKNSNIEMEIYTHAMFENNVQEIYDENGNLVKAVFFTNIPIKIANKN